MEGAHAVRLAVRAYVEPHVATNLTTGPMPSHVLDVIKLAARSPDALSAWSQRLDIHPDRLVDIAVHFIEQVLMTREASHYRVLGLEPTTSSARLRAHYRAMISWLHPDRPKSGWHGVMAERVNRAYTALKDPERRAAYDASLRGLSPQGTVPIGVERGLSPQGTVPLGTTAERGLSPQGTVPLGTAPQRLPLPRIAALAAVVAIVALAGLGWSQWQTRGLSPQGTVPVNAAPAVAQADPPPVPTTAEPAPEREVKPAPEQVKPEAVAALPVVQQARAEPPQARRDPIRTEPAVEPAEARGQSPVGTVAAERRGQSPMGTVPYQSPAGTVPSAVPSEARALAERLSNAYAAGDFLTVLSLVERDGPQDLAATAAEVQRWHGERGGQPLSVVRSILLPAEAGTKDRAEVLLVGPDRAGLRVLLRQADDGWRVQYVATVATATAPARATTTPELSP